MVGVVMTTRSMCTSDALKEGVACDKKMSRRSCIACQRWLERNEVFIESFSLIEESILETSLKLLMN